MDVPVFAVEAVRHRAPWATIGAMHVVVVHGMLVGGVPLVAFLEQLGVRAGQAHWDRLASTILSAFLTVAAGLAALTAGGVWLSAVWANPQSVASIALIYFWTWLPEWLSLATGLGLLLAYAATWKSWTAELKPAHAHLGSALSLAAWLTLALIVASGSRGSGAESSAPASLLDGTLAPVFWPQLLFRLSVALMLAGTFGLAVVTWATERETSQRLAAVRVLSRWTLYWTLPCALAGAWYARVVIANHRAVVGTASPSESLDGWYAIATGMAAGGCAIVAALATAGSRRPAAVRTWMLAVLSTVGVMLLGTFERVPQVLPAETAVESESAPGELESSELLSL